MGFFNEVYDVLQTHVFKQILYKESDKVFVKHFGENYAKLSST